MDLGNAFVKPFIYGNLPFGKFLQGIVDQAVGHLAVEGIGHRPGDGGKGVSIAAQGNGKADAVHIVFLSWDESQALNWWP